MLLFLGIGRRVGGNRQPDDTGHASAVIDGAIFGLFGLLVAFTFSGASQRFDERRKLIVEETNDIGTAYLRLDLLPPEEQPTFRELFRKYLDSRIEDFKSLRETSEAEQHLARSERLQQEIWKRAVTATAAPRGHPDAAKLLLPALNQMFDITTTRRMTSLIHPPAAIMLLLFGLGLVSSFLVGSNMTGLTLRGVVHSIGYVVIMAIAVFVIVDIEHPRQGIIRVDAYDMFLVELERSMNNPR